MSKRIATAYVQFIDTPGGKRRPIFVLRETDHELFFFDITTKYADKSVAIRRHYFEILDYESTGLRRHSWIDTIKMYSLRKSDTRVRWIGDISDRDTARLVQFIEQARRRK